MRKIKQPLTYAIGAFGHDAFYAALTTYFISFVTSELFDSDTGVSAQMIGFITTAVVVIRIVEIVFDPFIGALIDNTNTRWGKFKPWILGGSLVSSLALVLIFSNFFGLTESNPTLYLVLFVIAFIILDFSYSAHDVAFWGLMPALSLESEQRTKIGTIARFGSTLGHTTIAIVLVPINLWISHWIVGTQGDQQTRAGWLGFAIIIAGVSFIGSALTCWGAEEQQNAVRENVKRTKFTDVFKVLGRNDQLLWLALSYFMFALGFAITNSMVIYYFRYVLGKPQDYTYVGILEAILGMVSVIIFPFLQRTIGRKGVYVGAIGVQVIGYILYTMSGSSTAMALISTGLFYFPQPLVFLATLMTITDSVEYGQLKNGVRNESVTLTVRPLLDKLGGAISNGIVGVAAVGAGMTGAATAADISESGVLTFKAFMLFIPLGLLVLAAIVYWWKVSLTEARHDEIVAKLKEKLVDGESEAGNDETDASAASQSSGAGAGHAG